jgi:hypothetical protein
MRRLLAAAATGALLLLTACSTEPSGADTGTPATTAAVPTAAAPAGASAGASAAPGASRAGNPGDVALATNLNAICNQATKVSGTQLAAFSASAGSKDGAQTALRNWGFALGSLQELVADQGLKDAFGKASGDLKKLATEDPAKIDQARLAEIQGSVAKACAGK